RGQGFDGQVAHGLAEPPDPAAIDVGARAQPRVEQGRPEARGPPGRTLHREQPPARAGVAHLVDVVGRAAGGAGEPVARGRRGPESGRAHSVRTPRVATAASSVRPAMPPSAARIASSTVAPTVTSAASANTVGPAPLMDAPSAPASSAARLISA